MITTFSLHTSHLSWTPDRNWLGWLEDNFTKYVYPTAPSSIFRFLLWVLHSLPISLVRNSSFSAHCPLFSLSAKDSTSISPLPSVPFSTFPMPFSSLHQILTICRLDYQHKGWQLTCTLEPHCLAMNPNSATYPQLEPVNLHVPQFPPALNGDNSTHSQRVTVKRMHGTLRNTLYQTLPIVTVS